MFNEITGNRHAHVNSSPLALTEPVVAMGIDEVVEAFSQGDEPVHQPFRDLDVRVGFARPGNDQQVAAQPLGVSDRRTVR